MNRHGWFVLKIATIPFPEIENETTNTIENETTNTIENETTTPIENETTNRILTA